MIGVHRDVPTWNALAYQLYTQWQQFAALAQQLAADVAPYTDTQLAALANSNNTAGSPTFVQADCTALISGINIAAALVALANVNGTPQQAQANTASQTQVALGKFGGA